MHRPILKKIDDEKIKGKIKVISEHRRYGYIFVNI